jgi:hypothetical protein
VVLYDGLAMPGRPSRHPSDSALQSVLVDAGHPEVRGDPTRARAVARRFRAIATTANTEAPSARRAARRGARPARGTHFRFRQLDPSLFRPGSFRTFAVHGDPDVRLVFGRLERDALEAPLLLHAEACTERRTPAGRRKARPCEELYRARGEDLSVAVELPPGARHDPETTTLRSLLRRHGRSYVRPFSGRTAPPGLPLSHPNPFAGYEDFAACVRAKSRDPRVDSPGGVCATIERRSRAKHARRR